MDTSTKLSTSRSISDYVGSLIKESVKATLHSRALKEKEEQEKLSQGKAEPSDDKDAQSATMSNDTSDAKAMKEVPEYDDIVEKLNSIRAGKSLKDETIERNFQQYVDSLTDAEKVALFAFLKGISQIVSGQVAAPAAIDPGDKPADIEMKKNASVQKKSVKPNVVKLPLSEPETGDKEEKKSGKEQIKPPVVVKKRS